MAYVAGRDFHGQVTMPRSTAHGQHIATLAHEGRFWEVYLDIPDQGRGGAARGRLVFEAGDASEHDAPLHTGMIFVESTADQVVQRARTLGSHQLLGLLRSCLP